MPGATPIFGIPYPCSGETIDCTVFESFTDAIQNAVTVTQAAIDDATKRPNAQVYATGLTPQAIVIATDTTATFTTELYDNDNMADLAVSNDRLTIRTTGVYWIEAYASLSGGTTMTSASAIIQKNGVDVYRYKAHRIAIGADTIPAFALPVDCTVGDIIQLRVRWTGTGGPASLDYRRLTASLLITH